MSVIGIMDFMKCVLIIFTVVFVVEVTPAARNDENDVYINQKTRKLIVKTLMRMNEGYDKEPLQAVDFRCRNRATQTLLSQFPNAVVRWLHNGENISVRNKTRKTRIGCVVWQNSSQTRQIWRIYIPGEGLFSRGWGGTWGNFGTGERARILNPIIYLVLERNDL